LESRWRQTAALLGVEYPGITLVAQLLDYSVEGPYDPPFYLTNVRPTGAPQVQVLAVTNPESPPLWVANYDIPPAHPHFPYGASVLPDRL
jgi:hypothetical protein